MSFDASLNVATLLLAGAMSAMLAGVLWWYATPHQQSHYRHWTSAWMAQAAYYLIGAVTFTLAMRGVSSGGVRLGLSIATQVANTLAAALLLAGSIGFVRRAPVDRRTLRIALAASLVLGAAIALLAQGSSAGSLVRTTYRSLITAASFLGCGVVIWRHRQLSDRPARLLSMSLVAFGIAHLHYLAYALSTLAGQRPTYSLAWFTLVDLLWLAAIAIATGALTVGDQREASAAALSEQERAFRQMIEHSSDITAVFDVERAIQYLSPSAIRLLGWDDDVLGRPVMDFVHPDDQPALAERIRAPEPPASPFVVRVRSRGGNWLRLEAVSRRWENEQGQQVVIVNARDISERERLEDSLREVQKLESVGRLAGGVAHDLNNILTVIGSEVELVNDDAPEEVRAALHQIAAATDRAADLTRQLLTFARRQAVQPRVVDVAEAVSRSTRMARRLVPASIELRVAPAEPGLYAMVDPTQLEQVVMNLVVNARDAITEAGRIEVQVRGLELATGEVSRLAPGRYVSLTVRDTGSGIPDAVRPHVFEPFYTTKAQGEGTGLGLATSYGIARQANGAIRFESAVGAGTTFEVLVPRADAVPAAGPDPVPVMPRASGERVLVVEDDQNVRALAVRALTAAGFDVRDAADGIEALALFDEQDGVRVLVTDVIMPRLGGLELARRLRALDPALSILFLSGYPGDPDFERTLPPGAQFLQKPVVPSELVRAVQGLLAASVAKRG